MAEHILKTDPQPFVDLLSGRKTFELRKADRPYREGDTLLLRETRYSAWEMANAQYPLEYTGRELSRVVTHVLHGPCYGLTREYVVMSVKPASGVSRLDHQSFCDKTPPSDGS